MSRKTLGSKEISRHIIKKATPERVRSRENSGVFYRDVLTQKLNSGEEIDTGTLRRMIDNFCQVLPPNEHVRLDDLSGYAFIDVENRRDTDARNPFGLPEDPVGFVTANKARRLVQELIAEEKRKQEEPKPKRHQITRRRQDTV